MVKEKIKRNYRIAKYVVYRQTIVEPIDHLWTFLGAFIGIAAIGLIQGTHFGEADNIFLIGSFGASAVLIFGATNSPLAQPRNLIGGHIVSAIIGVCVHKLLPGQLGWHPPLRYRSRSWACKLPKHCTRPAAPLRLSRTLVPKK